MHSATINSSGGNLHTTLHLTAPVLSLHAALTQLFNHCLTGEISVGDRIKIQRKGHTSEETRSKIMFAFYARTTGTHQGDVKESSL